MATHEPDEEFTRMADLRSHGMVEATVCHVRVELLNCIMELHRWGGKRMRIGGVFTTESSRISIVDDHNL